MRLFWYLRNYRLVCAAPMHEENDLLNVAGDLRQMVIPLERHVATIFAKLLSIITVIYYN